jgi:ABC-type sugar transport system permease subunit
VVAVVMTTGLVVVLVAIVHLLLANLLETDIQQKAHYLLLLVLPIQLP